MLVAVSKLDVARERIAYLKLWLGALVVAEISLLGWLASNLTTASPWRVLACVVAAFGMGMQILRLHKIVDSILRVLRDL